MFFNVCYHIYNPCTASDGNKNFPKSLYTCYKHYRIYPRIGRTFFKEKNVQNLGCGLYAVNKVTESLTVGLNVSYEVKLIHVFEEFCFSPLQ